MKTYFCYVKIELVVPVFLGVVSSLLFCALLAAGETGIDAGNSSENQPVLAENAEIGENTVEVQAGRLFAGTAVEKRNLIQELYRKPETQKLVVDFFEDLCDSREIAEVILSNADAFDIVPALAFALSWEESRFNPLAVNSKNRDESIDRGLFQLNNRSFPKIETKAFFDPRINAWYGMGHLRHCLNTGETEIAALAMYNAGTGRVKNSGTPKITLDYVHRILENRRKIENQFQARLRYTTESVVMEKSDRPEEALVVSEDNLDILLNGISEKLAEAKPARSRSRFALLSPLAGSGSRK
jgi:hypothetical protein